MKKRVASFRHRAELLRVVILVGGKNDRWLVQSYRSLHRLNQLRGVVADSILEHQFHIFDIRNFFAGISIDHYNVRLLSYFERADAIGFAQKLRAILSGDANGFERTEASFHQQLSLSLIAKSR